MYDGFGTHVYDGGGTHVYVGGGTACAWHERVTGEPASITRLELKPDSEWGATAPLDPEAGK